MSEQRCYGKANAYSDAQVLAACNARYASGGQELLAMGHIPELRGSANIAPCENPLAFRVTSHVFPSGGGGCEAFEILLFGGLFGFCHAALFFYVAS